MGVLRLVPPAPKDDCDLEKDTRKMPAKQSCQPQVKKLTLF